MTTHELAELLLKEPNRPVVFEDYEGVMNNIIGIIPEAEHPKYLQPIEETYLRIEH